MVGIQQELLVPFRSQDGAFDRLAREAQIRRGPVPPAGTLPACNSGSRTIPPLPT
jgi:hypothetical protein